MSLKLSDFCRYQKVVIQCHDNPDADALASGFVLRWFLAKKGVDVRFVYGGANPITKSNLCRSAGNSQIKQFRFSLSNRSQR